MDYSGANDDASGLAVMLETVRLWQETGYQPQRSILFAAWGAQEAGEVGSNFYVANPAVPLTQTVGILQLDAVGGGGGYYLSAQGFWETEGMFLYGMKAAEDLVDGRLKTTTSTGISDQLPFRTAGAPGMLATWTDANETNWPDSIADEVEPNRLGVTGRMVVLTMMSVAR
ncbi:MAG: M28 family metallopeptidase [Anaerolineae bacterium]